MKKIIKNRVYDTDTAADLGTYATSLDDNLNYVTETLYRKKTGEYFLWGQGGPQTKYAVQHGLNWSGSSTIIPLTYDAARQWAEEHLDTEEYEIAFGEIPEDDTTVQISLRLSASTAATIRRRAAEAGVGIAAWIEQLVRESAQ